MATLQGLKSRLNIDYTDDDLMLQDMLDSAIDVIEEYTNHSLISKTLDLTSDGCDIVLYQYPITDIVADDEFNRYNKADSVIISAPLGTNIVVTIGVSTKRQLEAAVYQLASYYYENREPDAMVLPTTIQGSINQLRRGLFG